MSASPVGSAAPAAQAPASIPAKTSVLTMLDGTSVAVDTLAVVLSTGNVAVNLLACATPLATIPCMIDLGMKGAEVLFDGGLHWADLASRNSSKMWKAAMGVGHATRLAWITYGLFTGNTAVSKLAEVVKWPVDLLDVPFHFRKLNFYFGSVFSSQKNQ